jgi:hypothetical protein
MKHMIRLGVIATIAVAGNAAQARERFCSEITEVVAAARETPPFSSFPPNSWRDGRRMLGFSVCGTESHDGYPRCVCGGSPTDPRPWSDEEELALLIEQCLPQAVRAAEEAGDSGASRPGRPPRVRIGGGVPWHRILIDLGTLRFTVARESNPRVSWIALRVHDRGHEGR